MQIFQRLSDQNNNLSSNFTSVNLVEGLVIKYFKTLSKNHSNLMRFTRHHKIYMDIIEEQNLT
jgi:hypothetical protein